MGGQGARVNAVCPGWVKTEMDEKDLGSGAYTAQAIAFLADDRQSAFVNGHTLSVDGGWAADGSWDSLRLKKR